MERLRALIEQVREEMKGEPENAVAARLGLQESHYSKIRAGKPRLYTSTLEKVIASMRLDPRFFFDPELGPAPNYHDFVRKRSAAPSARIVPHWDEFAREWPEFSRLTPAERQSIQGMITDLHEIRHWTDWITPARWVLSLR